MTKAIVVLAAATIFAGCAGTREQRAAAFQQEVPRLVAACNGWRQSDVVDGQVIRGAGLKACSRLRDENSLQSADPAAANAYMRYAQGASPRSNEAAAAGASAFQPAPSGMSTIYGPGGAPQ
jgi:hypothetical protein